MTLKKRYKDKAEIPTGLEAYYKAVDGGAFELTLVDEADDKSRIDEFRTNNIQLTKERDEAKRKADELIAMVGGLDPKSVKLMKQAYDAQLAEEEKRLLEAGQWDEVVKRRTKSVTESYTTQVKQKEKERDDAVAALATERAVLGELLIEKALTEALNTAGVRLRQGAQTYLMSKGKEVWKVGDNRKLVAKDANGVPMAGKSGELTMPEFLDNLVKESSFLFEGSTGGDANPKRPGSSANTGNTHVKVVPRSEFAKHADAIAKGEARVAD